MAKRESYRNVRKEKYTQVSNSLLNDGAASLQAKGLLSIFLSNSHDWEINMPNIISRSKNGRDAHYAVVNELIKLGYFARIQVLDKKNRFEEMVYIFSDIKKDVDDEIQRVKQWAKEEGKNLKIDYAGNKNEPFTESQDTESPKPESQYNNNNKEKNTKINNTNINTLYTEYIDDDKRALPQMAETSAIHKHNDEYINLVISNLREATKEELRASSFKNVVRKVMDKYNQGKIKSDFRAYLVSSVSNKIEELEFRRMKDKANKELRESRKQEIANKLQKQEIKRDIPFYNWLED